MFYLNYYIQALEDKDPNKGALKTLRVNNELFNGTTIGTERQSAKLDYLTIDGNKFQNTKFVNGCIYFFLIFMRVFKGFKIKTCPSIEYENKDKA